MLNWDVFQIVGPVVAILHFDTKFKSFLLMKNRNSQALCEAPLAASISANFLFKKTVEGPFYFVTPIFGEKQPQLVGIGGTAWTLVLLTSFGLGSYLRSLI